MAQMACRDNEGDFKRAVVMSGIFGSPYEVNEVFRPKSLELAEKKGERLFDYLGVRTLEEARKLDANYICSKYSELRNHGEMFFTIVQDGHFCTDDPTEAFRNGSRIRVPVMGGNTGDEFIACIHAADDHELDQKAKAYFDSRAEEFLAFPEARVRTDSGYAPVSSPELGVKDAFLGESRQKDPKNCYYYRFIPDIPGKPPLGTFHSVDLWFFFETLAKCSRPFEGRHYDLARQMCDYWANFIKTGDPNGFDRNGSKLPEWKPYTDADRNEMLFTGDGAKASTENNRFLRFLLGELK